MGDAAIWWIILAAFCGVMILLVFGMVKVGGDADRQSEELMQAIANGKVSMSDLVGQMASKRTGGCSLCRGSGYSDYTSFAIDPCPRCQPAADDRELEPEILAGSAIRHTAQALAELTRFNVEGAKNERFPLDEDVEVFLAKALQATINILLAYQPSEPEREELGQLEAALHKFITDYGA